MPPKSPIAIAMAYFGRKSGDGIKAFKTEWDALTDTDKEQLIAGLADETLTY